jgi:UDP-glucuronate 4-epimerase
VRANITGTLHVLELARRHGAARLIFGSSSMVYGSAAPVPYREDHGDPRPASPYAASKLAAEYYCRTWALLHRLAVVCLRIASVYGPRQRLGSAVPNFVSAIETGQPAILYGDGSALRDYFYVSDFVAAVLAALTLQPAGEVPFELLNLGSGRGVPVTELLAAIERAAGRTARRQHLPEVAAEGPGGWSDISRAHERLGWRPRVSLEEGLAGYVEWFRSAGGREKIGLDRTL